MAVGVHVVFVDIGNHGEHGTKIQEGGVAFVGLGHDVVALPELGVTAGGGEFAADNEGGVEAGGAEDGGGQAGGGGFAMGAGDGDALAQAHQFGQHQRARNHRNVLRVRGLHFGIVGLDGGGGYDDIDVFHLLGAVAVENADAGLLQALGYGAGGLVGAGNAEVEVVQHFGDAAHAGAADADEVDFLDAVFHGVCNGVGSFRAAEGSLKAKSRHSKAPAGGLPCFLRFFRLLFSRECSKLPALRRALAERFSGGGRFSGCFFGSQPQQRVAVGGREHDGCGFGQRQPVAGGVFGRQPHLRGIGHAGGKPVFGVSGYACGVAVAPVRVDFVVGVKMPVGQILRGKGDAGFFGGFAQGSLKRGFARLQAAGYGLPETGAIGTLQQQGAAVAVVQQHQYGNGAFGRLGCFRLHQTGFLRRLRFSVR